MTLSPLPPLRHHSPPLLRTHISRTRSAQNQRGRGEGGRSSLQKQIAARAKSHSRRVTTLVVFFAFAVVFLFFVIFFVIVSLVVVCPTPLGLAVRALRKDAYRAVSEGVSLARRGSCRGTAAGKRTGGATTGEIDSVARPVTRRAHPETLARTTLVLRAGVGSVAECACGVRGCEACVRAC
ncbi:unnamed protein product [Scytosiphon promiscuus]